MLSHVLAPPQLAQCQLVSDCEALLARLFSKSSKDKIIFSKTFIAIKLFPCNHIHLEAVESYYEHTSPAGSPAHQAVHPPPSLLPLLLHFHQQHCKLRDAVISGVTRLVSDGIDRLGLKSQS